MNDLKPVDAAHFTGEAGLRELLPARRPALPTSAAVVRFEPDVRNHWHAHEGGQLLYVIEGEGWVSGDDGEAVAISRGQAAYWAKGEVHGAGTETGLTAVVLEGDAFSVGARPLP